MATYYVYSPHNGALVASNCYCYRRSYDPCNAALDCPTVDSYPFCKDKSNCVTCTNPCFCASCCYHVVVGEASGYRLPLDVSASVGSWVYAYMTCNISSVKIIHMNGACLNVSGDITLGTYVEAWTGLNASGKRLGRLLFAHLSNRQHSNNQVINKPAICQNPWQVSIGTVPSVPANQKCYLSAHTHFSIWADAGVTASRTSSGCGTSLSKSSSAIYWWTY